MFKRPWAPTPVILYTWCRQQDCPGSCLLSCFLILSACNNKVKPGLSIYLSVNGEWSFLALVIPNHHSCQVSQFGRDSPGIWPYVPVVSRFTWFCSIVPESSSIAQMEVWHKHKLSILSNFNPYISMFSGCGSMKSPKSRCGCAKVGVICKISHTLRAH